MGFLNGVSMYLCMCVSVCSIGEIEYILGDFYCGISGLGFFPFISFGVCIGIDHMPWIKGVYLYVVSYFSL